MMKTVDIGRQARDQTGIRHFVSKIDGARKSKGIGPTVALHRNAVKAQKCAPVDASGVHFLLQNPETALRAANGKFERRFRYIETALRDQGRKAEECSLEELDALWGEAKREEKNPLGCG